MKKEGGYFADNRKLNPRMQAILDRHREEKQQRILKQLKKGKIVDFPFGFEIPEENKCPHVPSTGCSLAGLIEEGKRYLLDDGQVMVIGSSSPSSCQHCKVRKSYRSALDRLIKRWVTTGGPPRTLAIRPC